MRERVKLEGRDLVGAVVLEYFGAARYRLRCSCGQEFTMSQTSIMNGAAASKGCGCRSARVRPGKPNAGAKP